MSDDEILEVVRAHKEGKKIQIPDHNGVWRDCDLPNWDFYRTKFRVAPEPRQPREFWLCNGANRKDWLLIPDSIRLIHAKGCIGEMIRVREVIE